MIKLIVASVVICSCLVSLVAGQASQKREGETAKVRDKVIERSKSASTLAEVKLRNGTKLLGLISQPLDDKFTLTEMNSNRVHEIAYKDVSSVRWDFTARMNRSWVWIPLAILGIVAIAAAR